MSTNNIDDIANDTTFGVWRDRTNALIDHANKGVTLGDSETNAGNIKLNGDIVLESGHKITVDNITAQGSTITLDKNLLLDDGNIRIDGAAATSLTFSLGGVTKWTQQTSADHGYFEILGGTRSLRINNSGADVGKITGANLKIDDALLPDTITSNLTGNVTGSLTGDVTGNTSGSSGSCTGNAATATTLATSRTIGGVAFNGSASINLPGVNSTGNQNTSGTSGGLTSAALKAILESIYPVGAIYITTKNENPYTTLNVGSSDSSWEAFAQGRAIVGADTTGISIEAASLSANSVTVTVDVTGLADNKHPMSIGDKVTISGITGYPINLNPNASGRTITAITDDTFTYAYATGGTETYSGFTNAFAKQDLFAVGDKRGYTGHILTEDELAGHAHHLFNANVSSPFFPSAINYANRGRSFSGQTTNYEIRADSGYPILALSSNVVNKTSGVAATTDQAHNNLQPYIATYVWKRVS